MTRAEFLRSVWSDGQARVAVGSLADLEGPASAEDRSDVIAALEESAAQDRWDFPGVPPELDPEAGVWGVEILYRTCVAIVFRDLDREAVDAMLSLRCPAASSPTTAYSVDLSLRFLPDVIRIARAASENDPLLKPLMALAAAWSLSSVGVSLPEPADVSGFWSDSGLQRLYVDRIIEKGDRSRLDSEDVKEAVRSALGDEGDLSPKLFEALREADRPAENAQLAP